MTEKLSAYLLMPEGLSEHGQRAWRVIVDALKERGLEDTGGCKVFYSPREWRERGEEYGTDSELIVVYDGADAKYLFSLDADMDMSYRNTEYMNNKLHEAGLYAGECTCWYSAIYER